MKYQSSRGPVRLASTVFVLLSIVAAAAAVSSCGASPPSEVQAAGVVSMPSDDATQAAAEAEPTAPVRPAQSLNGLVASGHENRIADVAERVSPSVVNLTVKRSLNRMSRSSGVPFDHPLLRRFFGPGGPPGMSPRGRGRRGPMVQRGVGSGVIVSSDGFILTNNHIVEHADEVRVELSDGREFQAQVVGTDPPSDLALIRVQAQDLPALGLGDSANLRVGEIVLAVGNPFGVGQTVTMGIVSATGRTNMGITDYDDFIQTDASINPGNSGGALVNIRGELIGINTAIVSRSGASSGVGFAIPSDMAQSIMTSLRDNGRVVRGWLGVGIQELNDELAASLGMAAGTSGVLVSEVMPDTPAAQAGLQAGDVIVELDGEAMEDPAELRSTVASRGAGVQTTLGLIRGGQRLEAQVTLGELPSEHQTASNGPSSPQGNPAAPSSGLEGVTVAPATPEALRRAGASSGEQGVVVTSVEPGSAAAEAGLRPGDLILEINRNDVGSLDDLRRAAPQNGAGAMVRILRDGHRLFLAWT